MAETNFVDYVKIYCTSGNGGAGVVSWRREKHVPLGGPAGGDGGRGGHIILRGNAQQWTLLDLKYRKFIKAEHGQPGQSSKKQGRGGADEVLEVPVGVIAKDAETDQVLAEITEDGQEVILLQGGRGGLGNWHFRTSTNQSPDYAQPGEPGQERAIVLELKLLADVGLVGLPNAGKSTLLSVVSAAKPEIADYPFTTLVPNLGLVRYRDGGSFVMADIPGIIEGASQGKGLGTRFLRHIERNAVLLLLIPIVEPTAEGLTTPTDIEAQYALLRAELEAYDPWLLHKPHLVALTKADLAQPDLVARLPTEVAGTPTVVISAVANQGIDRLLDRLWALLQTEAAPLSEK
ncbi:MAG: GTPase ObgE [Bacteroidia bacterium]|nr:GTPase ObgE [Bacteroidia bacterium]